MCSKASRKVKRKNFLASAKKKLQLLMKLEKGASLKWLSAEFGVGMSTIYGLEPEICLVGSQPSQVRGLVPIVESEIAYNLCVHKIFQFLGHLNMANWGKLGIWKKSK
jgi:hypothetical protein